jgi:hypothetical protein
MMPNLAAASIEGSYNVWDTHTSESIPVRETTSTTLQSLTILRYRSDSGRVLGALVAPALRRLVTEHGNFGSDVEAFLMKSHCPSLITLKRTHMCGLTLLDVLAAAPHVTHLEAHGKLEVSSEFVGRLMPCIGGAPLLAPNLTSLSLSGVFV